MTILDPESGLPGTTEDNSQTLSEAENELREEALIPAAAQKHPTLLKLRAGQCRFPIGERLEPARFFCGKPALAPLPYCRECCQLAYVPMKKR